MKIKNQYSKNRHTKEERILNAYMNVKQRLRLGLEKIIPLNESEKILYKDNLQHNIKNTMPKENKYFGINAETILLSAIPKTDLDKLYRGLKKLLEKHPFKGMGSLVFEGDLKELVFQFSDTSNNSRYTSTIYLSPNTDELDLMVEHLGIDLFDLSNDYIGISIYIKLKKEIKEKINNIMKSDCNNIYTFCRYFSRNKKRVTKMTWNPDIPRRIFVNDYLIEIKSRVYHFIYKYIKLFPNEYKTPISLDVYSTNYDLNGEDDGDPFLFAYDIYLKHCRHGKISVIHRDGKNKSGDEFIESDFCFVCSEDPREINRSGRMIIYKEDEEQQMPMMSSDLINLFIIILYFYHLGDFQRALTSMRNALYEKYDKGDNKIYTTYNRYCKIMAQYKMMFNNVRYSEQCHLDEKIKSSFDYQSKRYKELLDNYHKIEIAYNNKMLVSNYRGTYNLAKWSLVLSIISIGIALFYKPDNTATDKIVNEIKKINNTIQKYYTE